MSFTKFRGLLKQSLIKNSKWFQKTSILQENISWRVTRTENDVSDTFMNSKDQMKKKQREKITVSLEKLKCAKTDSPTCKLYWLAHHQIENLQWITSWKISVEQAFHMQI